MESAIAETLKCPRSRARRIDDDYVPSYPAWVARSKSPLEKVVMGYFGVQSLGALMLGEARAAAAAIVATFDDADGPGHHDLAHYVDAFGYDTIVAIAYWADPARFERWQDSPAVHGWWNAPARLVGGLGYFREIVSPHVERFETLLSQPDRLEGIGIIMGTRSVDDIQEHAYWGAARDRLALSQTDALSPTGEIIVREKTASGKRIVLQGHDHVALIRSGQEWTQTQAEERRLYLDRMEPVLREGMDFIRDSGLEIGCYSNRYMRHIDPHGRTMEKTFGLSYWRCLADMERWAEHHPTHIAIFGTFMQMVQALGFQLKLRLYHEVTILKPSEQVYEYINCHARTGLLNARPP